MTKIGEPQQERAIAAKGTEVCEYVRVVRYVVPGQPGRQYLIMRRL